MNKKAKATLEKLSFELSFKKYSKNTIKKGMAYDRLLVNIDLKKIEENLKTPEAKEKFNRIATEDIPKWPKPTLEQLNTPMDI
jgi:hypothetical protein